jgi:sarcosine oxidase
MEGGIYLPLLERAEELWLQLEGETGRSLFRRTGGLMLGAEGSALLAGALASARLAEIPHDWIDPSELARRYPALTPPPGTHALFEPGAGVLDPEACVLAHLDLAGRAGATLSTGVALRNWEPLSDGVRVHTSRGVIDTGVLVLAAGPWNPVLLAGRGDPGHALSRLEVERQVTGRFSGRMGEGLPDLPVLMLDRGDEPMLYVIPEREGTLKAGLHHGGDRAASPSGIRREPLQDDEVRIALPLAGLVPSVAPRWIDGSVCLYTNAPEGRWLIGAVPGHPRVILVSACSGHGFKASSAVGEVVAALALGREPGMDLSPFSPGWGG